MTLSQTAYKNMLIAAVQSGTITPRKATKRYRVLCESACVDALTETPNYSEADFIDEALDLGWIVEEV